MFASNALLYVLIYHRHHGSGYMKASAHYSKTLVQILLHTPEDSCTFLRSADRRAVRRPFKKWTSKMPSTPDGPSAIARKVRRTVHRRDYVSRRDQRRIGAMEFQEDARGQRSRAKLYGRKWCPKFKRTRPMIAFLIFGSCNSSIQWSHVSAAMLRSAFTGGRITFNAALSRRIGMVSKGH